MFQRIIPAVLLMVVAQFAAANKIVVFDHEQAIMATDIAKTKVDKLKAEAGYAQLLAQGESLRADLEALAKELNSKGMTWDENKRAEHRKKMEYIQADLKLASQKIQAENQAVMQEIGGAVQPLLEEVLKNYIESNNIEMVLKKQATYMAAPAVDITPQIVEALNKSKK